MNGFKRFAWDGIAFRVPAEWELSFSTRERAVRRVEMEDSFAHRFDAEWIFSGARLNPSAVEKRYLRAAKSLTRAAKQSGAISGLASNFAAFLYEFPDGRKLATAWTLIPERRFFLFAMLHFEAGSIEQPEQAARELAAGFEIQTGPLLQWQCYDLDFTVPRALQLEETEFLAGRKKFRFAWRGRRLHLWFFSLADLVLKKRNLYEWAAQFLAAQPGMRGPRYQAAPNGIRVARRAWRPVHMDQFSRLCFRYRCGVFHDREHNRIVLWAYHYRREKDLERLKGFSYEGLAGSE